MAARPTPRAVRPLPDLLWAMRSRLPLPGAWRVETVRIPMSDHVELGADLYRPARSSRGVVLVRGPYGRARDMSVPFVRVLAGQGYTVLFASTRGTGDSDGDFDPMRTEAADGRDLVEWMRAQPWYPGAFATLGGSYLGHTQWALLADPPADLVASVITMGPHDFARHTWGTGTINLDLFGWSERVATPGIGPLRARAVRASFRDRVRPVMGSVPMLPAAERFFAALGRDWVRERLARPDLSDPFWTPMRHDAALEATTTPTLLISGWHDIFLAQSLEQYRRLRERGVDVALRVGEWTHSDLRAAHRLLGREILGWLDTHLAGTAPSSRPAPAPVRVEVSGRRAWREVPQWPAASTSRRWHLHPDGTLADATPAADAPDASFTYDPMRPTPTVGGDIILDGGSVDDAALAARDDVLVYDSEPLTADLTVLGAPVVTLAHATERPDADLFVRVSDVDARGRSRNVTQSYRRIEDADGTPRGLPLLDTAHVFRAGHRIRLLVAGGSFPQFARNPGTGENPLAATQLHANRHTVRHAAGASALELPVAAGGESRA